MVNVLANEVSVTLAPPIHVALRSCAGIATVLMLACVPLYCLFAWLSLAVCPRPACSAVTDLRLRFMTYMCCTALHCTALHCTALHCTLLHCTVRLLDLKGCILFVRVGDDPNIQSQQGGSQFLHSVDSKCVCPPRPHSDCTMARDGLRAKVNVFSL